MAFTGCASQEALVESEAIQKYLPVSTLKTKLANEAGNELALLSPKSYAKATGLYAEAMKAKLAGIQSLFSPEDADVYRQANNVLIRAHGFSFKSGNSEIDASNFALLNKITKAISEFPDA